MHKMIPSEFVGSVKISLRLGSCLKWCARSIHYNHIIIIPRNTTPPVDIKFFNTA
jgi:hypothetical protein